MLNIDEFYTKKIILKNTYFFKQILMRLPWPTPGNADIVAGGDGKTIDDVEAFRVELMAPLGQAMEQRHQQMGAAM